MPYLFIHLQLYFHNVRKFAILLPPILREIVFSMETSKTLKLKIGFFNINGLVGETSFHPEFKEKIGKYDIIILTETWHKNSECIDKIKSNFPKEYKFINNARKQTNKKSKRNSGRILVCYKSGLKDGIVSLDKTTENMIWFKIKKEFLNTDRNFIIGGIYNSPINSSYTKANDNDIFETIQTKLMTFPPNDYILIGGDFNARVGNLQDFIEEDDDDIDILNLPSNYKIDKYKKERSNQDQHKNSYGEKLIDLAISSKLKILNGRILGDLMGKYTYIGYNGISTVDYILGSENLLLQNYIHSFEVEDLTLISDHRPINVTLHFGTKKSDKNMTTPTPSNPRKKNTIIRNYEDYTTKLNSKMSYNQINCMINNLEVAKKNKDTSQLNTIIQTLVDMYTDYENMEGINREMKPRKPKKSKKVWYDKDCKVLKRKLNQIRKIVEKNPQKNQTRQLFYKTQKEYRKIMKFKRRKYEEGISKKLENLYSQDRNEFWSLLKSMKATPQGNDLPQLNILIKHFKNLFFEGSTQNDLNNINETINNEIRQKFESLNSEVAEEEVRKGIQNLKCKKSPGDDQILNEMIKCTNKEGIRLITKLFNTILDLGYFPKEWNYGLLKLIHKGGDTDDENNYRAITLNSCLGKLFCSILHNRLYPLLENEVIFCKEQAGFRKNHRTTDHIFLLRKIVKTYISQNKYLYTCFVDFSKAFDSIWREGLIKKISKIGLHGKFLNIIKSIYCTTTNSIIYGDKLSETFGSNKGVKQGDTLSTILFNLYINDLPEVFNFNGNNPITIGNTNISCLKYADDLIIMSTSPHALQKCIAGLEQYCIKWKLEVNLKKTKIMIFNKQGSLIKKHIFYYKKKIIENVKEYKYLGFTFSCSGSDKIGISNLLKQAKKAWYAIRQLLWKSVSKNIRTYLHLFDTQVKPIILYGGEAWGGSLIDDENMNNILRKSDIEKFHISVLKQLLGVHKRTTNIAMLLETGRHPIALTVHLQSIKYFLRLQSLKKGSLLNIYYENEKLLNPDSDDFIKCIKNKLNKIGMSYIWMDQMNNNKDFSNDITLVRNVKKRLHDISSQKIIDTLSSNPGKLTYLANIKNTHNFETYLDMDNIRHRKAITKIRTSSHRLRIETGRWNNMLREQRICENCALEKIDDENHFLFECRMHICERNELINFITSKTNTSFSASPSFEDKSREIFNSDDLSILNALGKYIKNAFEKRENTTCYCLPQHYVLYLRNTKSNRK